MGLYSEKILNLRLNLRGKFYRIGSKETKFLFQRSGFVKELKKSKIG